MENPGRNSLNPARTAGEWKHLNPQDVLPHLGTAMTGPLKQAFEAVYADEGTLWIVEEQSRSLVPVYNSGPFASRFVARFHQPLDAGLISMVFECEQAFLENDMALNRRQSKLLDSELGVTTKAMIAVPFRLLGGCQGVLSCVKLTPGSFDDSHLRLIVEAADETGRRLEKLLPTIA